MLPSQLFIFQQGSHQSNFIESPEENNSTLAKIWWGALNKLYVLDDDQNFNKRINV